MLPAVEPLPLKLGVVTPPRVICWTTGLGAMNGGPLEPMAPDGRRRPYRLTPRGRSALRARLQEMREAVSIGLARVVG